MNSSVVSPACLMIARRVPRGTSSLVKGDRDVQTRFVGMLKRVMATLYPLDEETRSL